MDIQKHYLDRLKNLILENTENQPVKIWLFGSHAKGTTHRYSDIDIAILPKGHITLGFISRLKEKIEQSTIPYSVDIIDLSQTDDDFCNKVFHEGILWKD
ncbi:MAG: nucleotidyltransferase domain-containing protein [Gammaproteobacteria bacterium]|nr:nucleotidyltransferase domain-containing protein [Gammaproteobacteria bacterium]